MLLPQAGFTAQEYDAVFTITPTSRFDHESDTVFASVEMLVINDQASEIEFPFYVLSTDSGAGASASASVAPHVLNGSREVNVGPDDVDENAMAEAMAQRAQAAGVTDAAELEEVRSWGRSAVQRAERTFVGRTKLSPGERRRIVLQQRLRVLPGDDGVYVFETLAPSPIATIPTGGRISVAVLLPWEDDDIHPRIVPDRTTQDFEKEEGRVKLRPWIAWHWRNDPLLRVAYTYA